MSAAPLPLLPFLAPTGAGSGKRWLNFGAIFAARIIPAAKSYKESATLRVPVHCHERIHDGKSESALNVMTELVYELFPPIKDQGLKGTFFNEMDDLYEEYTPENDLGGAENEQ